MTEHYLKIATQYLDRIRDWQKTFEVRKNDRDYQVGDKLILSEYNEVTDEYIGSDELATITYVHQWLGMQKWYCILWIILEEEEEWKEEDKPVKE